jgi:sulfide:quinone oxidoreductase
MDVVIAGGGVAGLEALLGLHAMAGDKVSLTLIAPDPDFTYRPLAVAEPFALGHAHRVPLTQFTEDVGAELVIEALESVDDGARELQLSDRSRHSFDALLVAPGGRAVSGVEGATTWWPSGDADSYGGLLQDIDEGYAKQIAIVVPPGAVWPLPAYELALMTIGEAREMGQQDVQVTVVTPEREPLSLFGEEASRAVAEELRWAGIELRTGTVVQNASELGVQRVFAVPRIVGTIIDGLPMDEEAFILASDDGLVESCERTWAAGDGVLSPIKFGALATHQARIAAAAIARLSGATDVPDFGEPVLHGRLLVGRRSRRLRGRGDADGAPLWWPHGKVAGEYLPRWLAEHGVTPAGAETPPSDEGVTIRRPMHALRGPEAQYLFELGRQYRSGDPAIAALGRRMREMRNR